LPCDESILTNEQRIVALIELAERAAYYGVFGPFQNYIQNPYKSASGLPGALGLGQSTATQLTNFFTFFCYATPIFGLYSSFRLKSVEQKVLTSRKGAIVADSYLGKVKTIICFAAVYMLGLVILFMTSLPVSIENGYAFGGLMTAMILIGLFVTYRFRLPSVLILPQGYWWHQVQCLSTHRRAVHGD
jgi:POT family proton-dependent oligopeptide transporter